MTPTHHPTTLADLRRLVHLPQGADRAGAARFLSVEVESGLFLLSRELAVDAPLTFDSESFPASTLSVVLDGEATSHTPGVDGFRPNEVWIASDNDRRPCRTVLHGGRQVRTVELVVTPHWFEASRRNSGTDFEPLRLSMERPLHVLRRPLDAHLRRIAWQVLEPPKAAGLAALMLESRALDLLGALVEAVGEATPQGADALRARDLDRVKAIRERIDADPASIVSLAGLAEEFGVSASKLKRDFFSAFATCAGAYVNERRLLLGRALIEREGLSVSEASYRAGYGHPTNFSTAFRRRFGFAPSTLRR
ncbi:helix-turn-helix transcriptional regulator [Aquabacter sp. P-9]|uniref:helix-turn-helix transcriptional regulator n=1 Tax=Aquabacter sediminis TaxID=3029197 RepID=UPI00237E8373|nr:AraC family transcriptional regulator [Aquabacter sp. P-9]MDE1569131.1 AraC family transcriptional regulator [Aquabacter sp. P-9]